MSRSFAGWLIGVAAAWSVSCSFGINTDGLAGDGGALEDADTRLEDAHKLTSRLDGGGGSSTGGHTTSSTSGSGTGSSASTSTSGHTSSTSGMGSSTSSTMGSSTTSTSSSSTSDTCNFALVQAIPGTSEGQVIQQQGSLAWGLTETAGNLLVAIAYGGQDPGASIPPTTAPNMTFNVTDTLGNTYYKGAMYENSRSNQAAIQIFYAPNIKGGANTVTAVSAATGDTVWTGLFLQEYSGIALSNVVDISSGQMAPSSTETVTPGSVTTRTGCDLVVGAFTDGHVGGQNLSAGMGWSMRSTDDWDPGGAVDNLGLGALAGAVVNADMQLSGGDDDGWVAAQMAFRDSLAPALPQPATVAFTTPPQSLTHGTCSNPVNLTSKGAGAAGILTRSAVGIHIGLNGANNLTFYADPACAFPVSSVDIGAGLDSVTFYFKAGAAGTGVIAAAEPLDPMGVTQSETVN